MEAIGVNGLHAVVAPVLVRVEMSRKGQTYELLITQHRSGVTNEGKRQPLETRLLFRGIHGLSDWDLSGKDKHKAATVLPTFYSRAGEEVGIPKPIDEQGKKKFIEARPRMQAMTPFCMSPRESAVADQKGQ